MNHKQLPRARTFLSSRLPNIEDILYPRDMVSSPKTLSGSCACGAVSYTSTQNATHLDMCYCKPCQQISGAPVVGWMGIAKDALAWNGPIGSIRLSSFATREFCQRCGGTLTMKYDCYPGKTHVAAAILTRSAWEPPKIGTHIFVASKPAWYQIPDDGVPRWDGFDDDFARTFPDVVRQVRSGQTVSSGESQT